MGDQVIFTDKENEAIYGYSDTNATPVELSLQAGVSIQLFYGAGQRSIVVVDNGMRKEYRLDSPKKPENTNTSLKIGRHKFGVSKDLADLFPAALTIQ